MTLRKVVIFGNSSSGKSTLAGHLAATENLNHLDLDVLAWQPTEPPQRKPLKESHADILAFIESSPGWIIEGCYADLLEVALPYSSDVIFMNLPVKACIENARARPWEPHKYNTKESQDSNLDMLIDWIAQYADRTDTFSQAAHNRLYQGYTGSKRIVTGNTVLGSSITVGDIEF